ncbi:hypothetical protein EHQ52_09095 [Leptospira koniambonensis]|uniref:Uncharacterized protein n=5 Tax=Leptospiraceae TaxID=170 RepID=A0A4V3JD30_9LEPT|nr:MULTISPECIES: hypothetical protein [Leptospira]PKA17379.1 hypothetical protein CH363_01650 [Leptospira haakeii]PKA21103.1 hypothetical protein CH377_01650 [Leptospira haakeii]TGK08379.1 hypothetical protein EHO58_07220 [Leptospira selangorensis]TGK37766.1 hypothetical protein EHO65_14735 [Leptospira andrefontaineae]TGL34644.1 hypothetical protein EHQ52_09095 [Leptospira koniambonensis]
MEFSGSKMQLLAVTDLNEEEAELTQAQSKQYTCKGCGKETPNLFQYDLCRDCLNLTFRRLIKVIDSVRK